MVHAIKPCRGCGGPKGKGERNHFCPGCASSPLNRPLLMGAKCRNGHEYSDVGILLDGKRWRCRGCNSDKAKRMWENAAAREKNRASGFNARLKRVFGITSEEWMRMYDFQNGVCPICGSALRRPGTSDGKRAATDHDHATGLIRGLLCMYPCNRALGQFRDSISRLRASADYLETPPAVMALGGPRLTAPGRIGTKRRSRAIRRRRAK